MSDKSEIYSLRRRLDEAARRRDMQRALSDHEPGPEMRISFSASEFWPVGASRSLPDKGRPLRGRCAVWVASVEKPLMMTPMLKLAAVAPITLFEHDKPAITVRLSSISGSAKEWQAVVGLDGEHLYYVARLLTGIDPIDGQPMRTKMKRDDIQIIGTTPRLLFPESLVDKSFMSDIDAVIVSGNRVESEFGPQAAKRASKDR